MLRIKYKYSYRITDHNADGNDVERTISMDKSLPYDEDGIKIAKMEADGEYEIYDDGIEEAPTQYDILDARITYVEMMTGLLNL